MDPFTVEVGNGEVAAVVFTVAGTEEHVLLDAIEAGLLTGLVTEPGPGRIRFAHALVRDTLYDSLSRLRRSRLHARVAEAIERHSPGEVAALAYHFAEAGSDQVKAARYCRLAAGQAERRFAYHEAARLWERAIAFLDQAGDTPARDRLELVLGLVGALAQAGQLPRARSWRQDAVRAALPLNDPVLLARVITAFDVPRAWFFRGYGVTDDELVGTVEQTLAKLPPGDQPLPPAHHAGLRTRGWRLRARLPCLRSGRGDGRRLGDPFLLTMALGGRSVQCLSFWHEGLDERLRIGAELLALPGKPVTAEALAHVMLMAASSGGADFAAADQHAGQAARIAARYDLPTVAAAVSIYRATWTATQPPPQSSTSRRPRSWAGSGYGRTGPGWRSWVGHPC